MNYKRHKLKKSKNPTARWNYKKSFKRDYIDKKEFKKDMRNKRSSLYLGMVEK